MDCWMSTASPSECFFRRNGWRRHGRGNAFTVVCDPFDNSFLSTRSFRDSSVVISVGDGQGRFLCCALGDLATSTVYFADQHGSRVLEQDGKTWRGGIEHQRRHRSLALRTPS